MSQDYKPNLGEIITGDSFRDAIHLAVAPIEAGYTLKPGSHVGLLNGKADPWASEYIGIVDPFLKEDVQRGQMFWLLLYPNTITGLRHAWSHPAFQNKVPQAGRGS